MASRKANPAVIGAFVIGAIALSVAAILVFGSGRFFRETSRWVVYFDSSVMGLDIGAPVIFRGVSVGSVVEIAAYVDPRQEIFATPVYIELVRGSVRTPEPVTALPEKIIEGWVRERGLRAQLRSQSLVTGKLYVDLAFRPDTPLDLKGLDPEVPEIPSIPTALEEIENTIRAFIDRVRKMPLEDIVENLDGAIASVDELLRDPKLKSAVANLDDTLGQLERLAERLNQGFDDFQGDLDATLEQATKTFAAAENALTDVNAFIEPDSPLNYQLLVALEELSQTLRSLRALSDGLQRNPDQLLFGRGEPGGRP